MIRTGEQRVIPKQNMLTLATCPARTLADTPMIGAHPAPTVAKYQDICLEKLESHLDLPFMTPDLCMARNSLVQSKPSGTSLLSVLRLRFMERSELVSTFIRHLHIHPSSKFRQYTVGLARAIPGPTRCNRA